MLGKIIFRYVTFGDTEFVQLCEAVYCASLKHLMVLIMRRMANREVGTRAGGAGRPRVLTEGEMSAVG